MTGKKPSITAAQLTLMIIGSGLLYPYTILPIVNYPPNNPDVWIMFLLSLLYIIVLCTPILILANKFKGQRINDIVEMISGKIIGKIFLVIFMLVFLFCFIACMLIIIAFIKLYILFRTPEWVLLMLFVLVILYGVIKGAGVIGRISLFIVPFMMLSIIFLFIFALPNMNFELLKPVLADSNILDINLGAFLYASRFAEVMIFFVFSYYLEKKAKVNKIFFWGLIIYGILMLMIIMPVLTVLGSSVAKNEWNPYYVFTRQIEVYEFLRRLQAINILTWLPSALVKTMMYVYMISHIMKGIFKTKTHKPFGIGVIILGFIIIALGFMNRTSILEALREKYFLPMIIFPAIFVLPLILLIIYIVKRKKIDKELKQKRQQQEEAEEEENEPA